MNARRLEVDEMRAVEDALILARSMRPYYGLALAALQPWAVDGIGTVAVDSRWRLYVDPAWFGTLTQEQRAGLIAGHEIEHLLRKHAARSGSICAPVDAWLASTDAEINDDCDLPLPPDGTYPRSLGAPDGLTAEEYLAYATSRPTCDCGSGAGGGGRPYEIEGGEGVSGEAAEQIAAATASAVQAHAAAHGRGSVPAGIVMWADAVASGRSLPASWDRQLAHIIGRHAREIVNARRDYSFRRLHRRTRPGEVVRPAASAPAVTVALVVDTSGSMTEDGRAVLSTVRNVTMRYPTIVIDCDAEVKSVRRRAKEFRGGGGTDLRPALEMAASVGDVVVVVTDCDTPWPLHLDVPMLVIATGAGESPLWATRIPIS